MAEKGNSITFKYESTMSEARLNWHRRALISFQGKPIFVSVMLGHILFIIINVKCIVKLQKLFSLLNNY